MTANPTANGSIPDRASGLPLWWGEHHPQRIAIRSESGAVTYGQLAHSIRSTGSTLAALGLTRGDRLLIVSENSIATVVLFFASLETGVIPSIINARLSAAELAKIEDNARAKRTIYLHAASPDAARHAERVVTTAISDPLWGDARIGPANRSSTAQTSLLSPQGSAACIAYTTGTTGTPKGVVLSHQALIHMGRLSVPVVASDQQPHYYLVAPLAHIIGLGSNLMAALWSGASVELVGRFDIDHMIAAIRSRGITHLMCVPTVYAAILSFARKSGLARLPNQLLSMRAAGAPLSVALKEEIDVVLGLPLENGYGMTECSAIARTHAGESPLGSIGRPNEGVQVRILQSPGSPGSNGGDSVGRLLVKSPCAALGLWLAGGLADLPEMADGWLDTGDLARLDPDGNLFLVGRSKEIIIRSGFNVAPAEVEQVICRHEAVGGCAVIGHDRHYGETEIVAFIVRTPRLPPVTAGDLEHHCRRELVGYKRPSRFLFIDEIPLLPNGKIDRQSLVISAARESGRNTDG